MEKKNSVLIVDDENANILALTHILSSEYVVYAAKSGEKALEAAGKHLPDLILLDIIMSDMDGYGVISILKENEATKHIPVIFITGLSSREDEEKGLALGAVDYIGKPFSPVIVKLRVQNQIMIINQNRLIIEKEISEKSSRNRSEFLSRMSHEMRTPMNAIMGMTALAKHAPDTDKLEGMLEQIHNASDHLLKLIDDVLDMSDIEENKLHLHQSEFNFEGVIRDILNKSAPKIKAKHQSLSTKIDPSIPDTIVGDEKRLEQVILNLLSNAEKFTPEQGSIQINAFAREVRGESLTMQIEVIDNGIGIPAEKMERLFVPFEQGDGGSDRKFDGAGLGLAIAKRIVELMGGEIWVESEPERGSKFSFTFKTQLVTLEAGMEMPLFFEGKTALLVDDVEINREIVMAMLEDTGLTIVSAVDGIEAVTFFSAEPERFDVVLMDINMPGMDGVEATKRIRSLDATEGLRVPIIAMTANVLMDEVGKYLASGMTDHIGKPVDYDKLVLKLKKYLQ